MPGADAYATSKQRTLATAPEFARETRRLRFNAVEPGFSPATGLGSDANVFLRFLGPPVARMAIAVAALTGLRASEIRGLRWSDFDGVNLHIQRAVWRTVVSGTKTQESEAPVPVVPALRDALIKFRKGAPDSAYIFSGERKGAPLNLHNLARRVIIPRFKLANIPWYGWHAYRRSVGTILLG